MEGSQTNGNSSGGQSGQGDGGQGAGQQQQQQSQGQQQQGQQQQQQSQQNQQVDLKNLTPEQLAAVMDNPNFWKIDRIAELTGAKQKLDKLTAEQQQNEEKTLAEQKKFEELATKRGEEVTTLKQQIQNMQFDQALTNKLVGEGVVDLEAALKLVDRSQIKVDETSGAVQGVDEAIKSLKEGKTYLFTAGGQQQSIGAPTGGGNASNSAPAKFKRSQLQDQAFYQANRAAIVEAMKNGQIEDDLTRR